jgi:hypothetical protein
MLKTGVVKRDSTRDGEPDPFKRFDAALRKIASVSKDELLKRERAYKRQRAQKKRQARK